ncbi:MAG: response regulator [Verrucomicrobia bacterium]|nr:response regulator [Verrucomicrobiota bacterium]
MKILIIEDEPPIRQTLQYLLELNGHTVLAAADGPEGIALVAQQPELIFCDVGLPGMDGYQVIAALRELPAGRDLPFIFLTARADRDDQRRGMALGADDYITKPFTERDIVDAIAARIRRQQPLRERVEQLLAQHRSEVGADWSHELLTPLNGVLGGLELIEADGIQPGELKELLRLVRASAERQLSLSRKIALYFELERTKVSPSERTYHCDAAAVTDSAAFLAAEEKGRTADLTVRCDPGLVALAETHLFGAVTEIARNAFFFSQPGQTVTVVGTHRGSRYQIEVTDQGPGMTAKQRANVAAFAQFDRDKHRQQGLGLGLGIARTAATIVGGTLRLDSGPGERGLRVTLDLPVT